MNQIRNSRRDFLVNAMGGFGALAFAGLVSKQSALASGRHMAAKAKSIIYLYMEGGPSQVDTFDYKPLLEKRAGQPLPFEKPSTVFNSSNKIMPSPFKFRQYGESGSWVSSVLPHLATCVDDLTFIHSMHHDVSNHSAACYMSHTGDPIAGRPSLGSWMSYGLGSENEDLPGFVVLDCGQAPSGGVFTWSSGFLPSVHAGVTFHPGKTSVEFLDRLESSPERQQAKLRSILELNRRGQERTGDQRLESVIANYEKAARMQTAVPELLELRDESQATRKLYGLDRTETALFGSRCLIARRLVERGVRFVEIFSPRVTADRWDQHGGLRQGHINNCLAVDQPIAGLIKDLKSRGLLNDTIILWGGEFGRTPSSQGNDGRDHNPFGYSVFLAGGGFRPGVHYGTTDDFGYYAQQDKVHLHDLHATILHQMGIDHERLTYRFGGRDYRLTDVHGRVVEGIVG
mgnify:CR=1 FL=1|jgi:hypothetical protein